MKSDPKKTLSTDVSCISLSARGEMLYVAPFSTSRVNVLLPVTGLPTGTNLKHAGLGVVLVLTVMCLVASEKSDFIISTEN